MLNPNKDLIKSVCRLERTVNNKLKISIIWDLFGIATFVIVLILLYQFYQELHMFIKEV